MDKKRQEELKEFSRQILLLVRDAGRTNFINKNEVRILCDEYKIKL
jgi:hypothetical protein